MFQILEGFDPARSAVEEHNTERRRRILSGETAQEQGPLASLVDFVATPFRAAGSLFNTVIQDPFLEVKEFSSAILFGESTLANATDDEREQFLKSQPKLSAYVNRFSNVATAGLDLAGKVPVLGKPLAFIANVVDNTLNFNSELELRVARGEMTHEEAERIKRGRATFYATALTGGVSSVVRKTAVKVPGAGFVSTIGGKLGTHTSGQVGAGASLRAVAGRRAARGFVEGATFGTVFGSLRPLMPEETHRSDAIFTDFLVGGVFGATLGGVSPFVGKGLRRTFGGTVGPLSKDAKVRVLSSYLEAMTSEARRTPGFAQGKTVAGIPAALNAQEHAALVGAGTTKSGAAQSGFMSQVQHEVAQLPVVLGAAFGRRKGRQVGKAAERFSQQMFDRWPTVLRENPDLHQSLLENVNTALQGEVIGRHITDVLLSGLSREEQVVWQRALAQQRMKSKGLEHRKLADKLIAENPAEQPSLLPAMEATDDVALKRIIEEGRVFQKEQPRTLQEARQRQRTSENLLEFGESILSARQLEILNTAKLQEVMQLTKQYITPISEHFAGRNGVLDFAQLAGDTPFFHMVPLRKRADIDSWLAGELDISINPIVVRKARDRAAKSLLIGEAELGGSGLTAIEAKALEEATRQEVHNTLSRVISRRKFRRGQLTSDKSAVVAQSQFAKEFRGRAAAYITDPEVTPARAFSSLLATDRRTEMIATLLRDPKVKYVAAGHQSQPGRRAIRITGNRTILRERLGKQAIREGAISNRRSGMELIDEETLINRFDKWRTARIQSNTSRTNTRFAALKEEWKRQNGGKDDNLREWLDIQEKYAASPAEEALLKVKDKQISGAEKQAFFVDAEDMAGAGAQHPDLGFYDMPQGYADAVEEALNDPYRQLLRLFERKLPPGAEFPENKIIKGLGKFMDWNVSLLLASSVEVAVHSNRVLSVLSRYVGIGDDSRAMARFIPHFGPRLGGLADIWNVGTTEASLGFRSRMRATAGGSNQRFLSVGEKRTGDEIQTGVAALAARKGKKKLAEGLEFGRDFLFDLSADRAGLYGFDERARVAAGVGIEKILGRNFSDAEMRLFLEGFGKYNESLQSNLIVQMRRTKLAPFAGGQAGFIPREIATFFGQLGLPESVKRDLGAATMRKLNAEMVFRVIGGTAAFVSVAQYAWTKSLPWENEVGHKLDIRIGYTEDGRALYLPFSAYAPALARAANITMARTIAENFGEGTETLNEAGRRALNTAIGYGINAPGVEPLVTLGLGRGTFVARTGGLTEVVPPQPTLALSAKERILKAAASTNPTFEELFGFEHNSEKLPTAVRILTSFSQPIVAGRTPVMAETAEVRSDRGRFFNITRDRVSTALNRWPEDMQSRVAFYRREAQSFKTEEEQRKALRTMLNDDRSIQRSRRRNLQRSRAGRTF